MADNIAHVAYHEAGHAIVNLLNGRKINYVEITEYEPGSWTGMCHGFRIKGPITARLMQDQIVSHLAGGIAEAIHRGEQQDVLAFASQHCCMDTDRRRARAVLNDLCRLTGRRHELQWYAKRARWLLLTHWPAVTALASALVQEQRIEGDRVEAIIDHA